MLKQVQHDKEIKTLTRFQPTRNAHSWSVGQQHFVLQFVAFEKHAGALHRINRLQMIAVVDAQLSAIFFLPVGVQVHDHGECPAFVAAELIEVFFVKTTLFVQGVMEFVTCNARVAGAVQVAHEKVHQCKKCVLVRVVVLPVEPVNFIASDLFVVRELVVVSDAGRQQLLAGVQVFQVFLEVAGKGRT